MRPSSHRRARTPSELGYGETGGGTIPPNATLIFDIELLEVAETAEE